MVRVLVARQLELARESLVRLASGAYLEQALGVHQTLRLRLHRQPVVPKRGRLPNCQLALRERTPVVVVAARAPKREQVASLQEEPMALAVVAQGLVVVAEL